MLLQLRRLLWQYPEGNRKFREKRKIEELKSALSDIDVEELQAEINKEMLSYEGPGSSR